MRTLLQDIVALLAISNPLGALPVFLGITEGETPAERARLHAISIGGREAPARVRVFRDFVLAALVTDWPAGATER